MNIIKETSIRSKYHSGFARTRPVTEIILHGTGGGSSASALIGWMMGGERATQYYRGIALFHYLLDRNGGIYEIIDPDRWVYHSSSGRHDEETIGIELVNPNPQNEAEYTGEQYASLMELVGELMQDNAIGIIAGHGQTAVKYSGPKYWKNCPGRFDWNILADELLSLGYSFITEKENFINIKKV